ncbi:zinc-binding protein [Pseudomonas abyssi]|uniref:Zinc-binding protein n=1 Tax=Pseudomonas abyssi TaxID=170540 RepID=A0A2A3MD79_9PSED|nr:DUF2796 domain-containing protein [Pseudomonas abyssi]MAC99892.1 DUF2796 domain-containing protein [Pseudomonadales bacterium]PBK02758.1 zinc-binding protein [Pseudomonas abyssi]|tara:strand:- start:16456 stop:17046 length:591 start_codon:yes stop_codon:yes gene_type:complete
MRRTLLALALALPCSQALHAHEHEHEHDSLGAHEHGVASLNLVVDGNQASLELDSPAANLVGFEYQPSTDEDRATVARVKAAMEQADGLFSFTPAAGCQLQQVDLDSPLFAAQDHDEHDHHDDHEHAHDHSHEHGEHADIEGRFDYVCDAPEQLEALTLPLFNDYPAMQRIQVQAITASGQHGAILTAEQPTLSLD